MNIGFDISQTGSKKAGCGFYADTLIQCLLRQYPDDQFLLYPAFGDTYWDPDYLQKIQRINAENARYLLRFKQPDESYRFWGNPQGVNEPRIGSPDVVHSNNFSSPRLSQAKLVYTVYDLSFIDVPECTTEANRHVCFNGIFKASLLADMAIAISHYSKKRFLENFPHFPAERVVVAHLGNRLPENGPEERVPPLTPDMDFFLAVGTLEPRKNLRRLLHAYQAYVIRSEAPKPLALAGANGWLEEDLPELIKTLGLEGHVLMLGYVSDAALRWLYRHCWAFVYPSLYEGFGLPVLEAMAAGAATVTSQSSSLPEVGGDSVVYVDPTETESITAALFAIEEPDYRLKLQQKGKKRANLFSWQATAETVHQVYEEALKLPPRNRLLQRKTSDTIRVSG